MYAITYEEACNNLGETMERVVNNHIPVIITRHQHSPVVMMSLDDYNSWQETEYLTRSPLNAKDLEEAVEDVKHRRNLIKET
jgi:antitoxin YefM